MSERETLLNQLEPFDHTGVAITDATRNLILMSIAVSLKRLANILAEAWEAEKKSP